MKLITAHRILIVAAIAFFVLYAVLQLRHYVSDDAGVGALVQALVAAVVAAGLVVYFRSLRNWGRR